MLLIIALDFIIIHLIQEFDVAVTKTNHRLAILHLQFLISSVNTSSAEQRPSLRVPVCRCFRSGLNWCWEVLLDWVFDIALNDTSISPEPCTCAIPLSLAIFLVWPNYSFVSFLLEYGCYYFFFFF
jgi:hypothetical protein